MATDRVPEPLPADALAALLATRPVLDAPVPVAAG